MQNRENISPNKSSALNSPDGPQRLLGQAQLSASKSRRSAAAASQAEAAFRCSIDPGQSLQVTLPSHEKTFTRGLPARQGEQVLAQGAYAVTVFGRQQHGTGQVLDAAGCGGSVTLILLVPICTTGMPLGNAAAMAASAAW